jgi:hypothetical protein
MRRTSAAANLSATLEEVPLPDLLQLLATSKKSGTLALNGAPGEKGSIRFVSGGIRHAQIDGRDLSPLDAIKEMAVWEGLFELLPPTDREPATDLLKVDDVIRYALRDIEERRALRASSSPRKPEAHASIPQAPALLATGPAYPEAELTFVRHRVGGALDLALLVDETASMGPYIEMVRARTRELIASVAGSPLCKSLRVAIVSYRDHPPEDTTFVSRVVLPFSDDVAAAVDAVRTLDAKGGGDGPEAVTDGLFDLVRLGWRPDAAKVAVWFGDAPPHGVEPAGEDHFPGGCPCNNDWFSQAESCREMGITVYAIGCLPQLRAYRAAEHVYRTIARATHGMFLALHEARMLVPLIAGAAESTLDAERIDEHVVDLVTPHADSFERTDEAERTRVILEGLRRRNVRARTLSEDGVADFRDVVIADVEASVERLRARARVAW